MYIDWLIFIWWKVVLVVKVDNSKDILICFVVSFNLIKFLKCLEVLIFYLIIMIKLFEMYIFYKY